MALPSAVARYQGQIVQSGIRFTMAPQVDAVDWQLCDVEIQRAPDSAGSPNAGSAETIQILGPLARTGTPYTDYLPMDGVRRHYRWRHVRTGFDPGAWSNWLRTPTGSGTYGAIPVLLPTGIPRPDDAIQIVGQMVFDADLPPSVGGPAGAGVLTRNPVGIPYTSLRAQYGSAVRDDYTTYFALFPDTPGAAHTAVAGFFLPQGAKLVDLDATIYRNANTDTITAALYRLQDDGTSTLVATTTAYGTSGVGITGWLTETVSCSSHVVAAGQYQLRVVMTSTTNREDVRFRRAGITYTIPNLGVGL